MKEIIEFLESNEKTGTYKTIRPNIIEVREYKFGFPREFEGCVEKENRELIYLNNGRCSAVDLYEVLKKYSKNDDLSGYVFLVIDPDQNILGSTYFLTEIIAAANKGATFVYLYSQGAESYPMFS